MGVHRKNTWPLRDLPLNPPSNSRVFILMFTCSQSSSQLSLQLLSPLPPAVIWENTTVLCHLQYVLACICIKQNKSSWKYSLIHIWFDMFFSTFERFGLLVGQHNCAGFLTIFSNKFRARFTKRGKTSREHNPQIVLARVVRKINFTIKRYQFARLNILLSLFCTLRKDLSEMQQMQSQTSHSLVIAFL